MLFPPFRRRKNNSCRPSKSGSHAKKPGRRKLGFENLEPRQLLTSVTLVSQRDVTGSKQYQLMSGDYGGWGVYFSEYNNNDQVWFTYRGYAGWHSDVSVSDHLWHMVAVTYSQNQLGFYIDGQAVGTADAYSTFSTSGDYYLGGAPAANGGFDHSQPLTGSLAQTLAPWHWRERAECEPRR